MASTGSGKSRTDDGSKNESFEDYVNQISIHHEQTGCTRNVELYMEEDTRQGAFCLSCKEEWLLNDLNKNIAPDCPLKPVAHHYVPTFCCLQVSDTGHYVRWKDFDKLKKGDHVAWLRLPSYWHHAIVTVDVQEGASEFPVIEWSPEGIGRKTKKKIDLLGNCCYSPTYKVVYPQEIENQNPPNLVMLRASTMESLSERKYNLFLDNCEHFATFCKTGSYKCNQLFQYRVRMRTWIARFFVAFLHVAFVVSFSETIEWLVPNIDEDWLGATVLIAFECICLLMIIFITYKIDTPRESFKRRGQSRCTSACTRAVLKSLMQSVTLIAFVTLFGVYLVKLLAPQDDKEWSVIKRVGTEMGLGCLGGIIGNMVGFILFQFLPCPCCYTVVRQEEDTGKRSENDKEGTERHSSSPKKFVGSSPVRDKGASASGISESTNNDQGSLPDRKPHDGNLQNDVVQVTTISSKIEHDTDRGTPDLELKNIEMVQEEDQDGASGISNEQHKIENQSFDSSGEYINSETEAYILESEQDKNQPRPCLDNADF